MKKIIVARAGVHASSADVIREMVKNYGKDVFYDKDTHSIAKMVEETETGKVIEKEKETLDAKDAENLLDQNTKTVKKAIEEVSSTKDLDLLLETEKAGKNRKKVIAAIEETL